MAPAKKPYTGKRALASRSRVVIIDSRQGLNFIGETHQSHIAQAPGAGRHSRQLEAGGKEARLHVWYGAPTFGCQHGVEGIDKELRL